MQRSDTRTSAASSIATLIDPPISDSISSDVADFAEDHSVEQTCQKFNMRRPVVEACIAKWRVTRPDARHKKSPTKKAPVVTRNAVPEKRERLDVATRKRLYAHAAELLAQGYTVKQVREAVPLRGDSQVIKIRHGKSTLLTPETRQRMQALHRRFGPAPYKTLPASTEAAPPVRAPQAAKKTVSAPASAPVPAASESLEELRARVRILEADNRRLRAALMALSAAADTPPA